MISGTPTDLATLADKLAIGRGSVVAATDQCAAGELTLVAIEIRVASVPGVVVGVDTDRRYLTVAGDTNGLAILASNIQSMADSQDGGHAHIEYFPEHYYLAPESLPVIVESPNGGMPSRR